MSVCRAGQAGASGPPRRHDGRFHWLSTRARVVTAGGGEYEVGYHLVLTNRGPAAARDVEVEVFDAADQALTLLDLGTDELPIRVLDKDGRYPIPWIYEPFERHARRFEALLSWTDGAGPPGATHPATPRTDPELDSVWLSPAAGGRAAFGEGTRLRFSP